jgi:UDP-GlcNAc:undecaprenyl-phosphate GlcNAc-1-phosphate transferase
MHATLLASVDAPWAPAILPLVVAAMVCTATVPATIWVARRAGAVAMPDADRHLHPTPTPRLGGLAMVAGFAVAVALFGGSVQDRWAVVAICVAIAAAMVVDDLLGLPWWSKFLLEIGAGLAVAAAGMTIEFLTLPGGHVIHFELLALPITVAWVVGMQTSINLIDGVDGVAAGVVAIVAMVMLLAAINRLSPQSQVQDGVIVMAGALMGCCLGFLVWNFAPARVFMGDSGSHFLGVALGIMTIQGVSKVAVALALAVPLVALGMPIGDTAWAIVRRYRSGQGITEPDAGHIHHRLLDLGLSPRETALTFYLVTAILGCFSLALFGHRRILAVGVVLLSLSLIGLLWRNARRPAEARVPAVVRARVTPSHEPD